MKKTIAKIGLVALLACTAGCPTQKQNIQAPKPVEQPAQDKGTQLRSKYNCVGEADISKFKSLQAQREFGRQEAIANYMHKCLGVSEAHFGVESGNLVTVTFDHQNGKAFAYNPADKK